MYLPTHTAISTLYLDQQTVRAIGGIWDAKCRALRRIGVRALPESVTFSTSGCDTTVYRLSSRPGFGFVVMTDSRLATLGFTRRILERVEQLIIPLRWNGVPPVESRPAQRRVSSSGPPEPRHLRLVP